MKQNPLNFIYFALVALLLNNCSKEIDVTQDLTKEQSFFKLKTIPKKDLMTNKKIVKQLNKLRNSDFILANRNDYDETYDFFVETDSVKVVESIDGNYNSYTFAISNEEEYKDYNLVFSLNDNQEYDATIVEYDFNYDDSYTISYATIDLNNSDYLTTRQPGTFNYQCVMTMSVECTIFTEVNGVATCIEAVTTLIDTSCSYTYIANAPSNTTSNIYNYIWISGGGGGGGYSNNPPNNPNIGSSFNPPSFSLQFSMFFNSLTDDQQNFIDSYLGLKLKLFNLFDANINNVETVIDDVLENMQNNSISFEEALLENGVIEITDGGATKVNPAEELECFDLTQGAKLTVYVQQPVENSDMLVSNALGPGHAFIGIEQNGIVRQIGYYPDQDPGFMGVGVDLVAAIKSNYDYFYHVSISQDITSTQLTNIVNYAINFPPTYNTNNYACTDFAIATGNLGGMNLPSTTVSSLNFTGRSPAKLGQEIRTMTSTAERPITTTPTNSPEKQGDCD